MIRALRTLLCLSLLLLTTALTAGEPAKGPETPFKVASSDETPPADNTDLTAAFEEAGEGDKKKFTIDTTESLGGLQQEDVYKSGASFFTVMSVKRKSGKGASGGQVVLERTYGKEDPANRYLRVKGSGPMSLAVRVTLFDLYRQGGFALHPIAGLGIFMIILAINSLWLYRQGRQMTPLLIKEGEEMLSSGDLNRFAETAEKNTGLMAVVCRAMVDRWQHSTFEDIRERVPMVASAYINRLRWPVKLLNLVAVAAPLLGLLGTIVGMVIVFEGVANTTGAAKAALLASGIRVKLFSTAFALMVAIPALFLFFIFNQRVSTIISEVEIETERLLNVVARLKRGEIGKGDSQEAEELADATVEG